jgi:betaine-aldehyde dehydrogenase
METDMGPLISEQQRDSVQAFVEGARDERVEVIFGGHPSEREDLKSGYYYDPTVLLTENDAARVVQNEIFGPVVVILPYNDYDDAIERANRVPYGLAGSVWTRDLRSGLKTSAALRCGTVWLNDHVPLVSEMPHGGIKSSGFGKDMSIYALEEYTTVKHVMADITGLQRKPWHATVYGPLDGVLTNVNGEEEGKS